MSELRLVVSHTPPVLPFQRSPRVVMHCVRCDHVVNAITEGAAVRALAAHIVSVHDPRPSGSGEAA